MITIEDLDDLDADGAAARQRFEELQARAQQAGHELQRTASGFILRRGTASSQHSPDLETIARLLKAPRPGKVAPE